MSAQGSSTGSGRKLMRLHMFDRAGDNQTFTLREIREFEYQDSPLDAMAYALTFGLKESAKIIVLIGPHQGDRDAFVKIGEYEDCPHSWHDHLYENGQAKVCPGGCGDEL